MLTPEWYTECSEQILELYSKLEDAILRDIIRRLLKTGKITDTAKWQAEVLQEAGMLYNDIISEIADFTKQSDDTVRKLFEEAGVETIRANNPVYEESEKHSDIHLSDSMKQILNASYKVTMGNIENLTTTTAVTSQTMFISACNEAQMQVTSGAFSYQEVLKQAVRKFSDGVFVRYPSGHRNRIDVAIARAVRTGVGQASAAIGEENAKELGTDIMEIDAHSGARPSHAVWQGKLVSLSGKNTGKVIDGIRVLSLGDIGYGTGGGFRGWNCSHDWHPYIVGLSTPMYTPEQLAQLDAKCIEWNGQMYSEYEISQMQRKAENKIRNIKRKLVCYDEAGLKDDFQNTSVKLKNAERQLKDFLKATDRDREQWREQVNGFGRSQAQRAVWANKSEINKQIKQKYGEYVRAVLTDSEKSDILKNKESLSNLDARKWYLAHDAKIPSLIDKSRSVEEQARQAFELRNGFRTITRDLMEDQETRKELDKSDPNKTFEELVQSKMQRKNMTRDEAIEDILKTATKTRSSVNKSLGLE